MSAPLRIGLVGCGKAKLAHAAPACQLYTGSLFRGALQVASARCGVNVMVLSAKHGLVPLDVCMEPYELSLLRLTRCQREAWGELVMNELEWRFEVPEAELLVFAGAPYVDALRSRLPVGWTLVEPLAGLQIGERLAWLARERAALCAGARVEEVARG
ncbi:hypothetical protein LXT21_41720 [Myxococcus sp. K38C18041901]|uniref:DUF6884 domain-containing protein n=1 Tax=Myxococcus guangdongensis TaxID=2906760 RepID=UPI0020A80F2A|nr:DUF6884 domain-containing protein [Myxococcus guangdongensis]MCP3065311.1 hypothetical protein [Myxococcus guangdongensis]